MADRDPGPWQLAGEVGFTVTFGRGLDPGAMLAAYGADPASARALTHAQARDALPTEWGRPLLRAGMLDGAGAAPAPRPVSGIERMPRTEAASMLCMGGPHDQRSALVGPRFSRAES